MGRKRNTLENVWKKIDKRGADECWLWTGGGERYGIFSIAHENYQAHRVVYVLTHPGSIKLGMKGFFSANEPIVLHKCDTPKCCNPAHLFLGLPKDNTRDMIAKGRRFDNRGERHPRAKFTSAQIRDVRRLRSQGWLLRELAEKYEVDMETIRGIVKRKYYADVD